MIKKTLVSALAIIVLYNFFIYIVKPKKNLIQSMEQTNIIRAQEYVYNEKKINSVIVGSSLSSFINPDMLPGDFYNLSFPGMGIYDGLEIIKKNDKMPKTILVEINYFVRESHPNFINTIYKPIFYDLKAILPAFQEKYQPMSLFIPLWDKLALILKKFRDIIISKLKKNEIETKNEIGEKNRSADKKENVQNASETITNNKLRKFHEDLKKQWDWYYIAPKTEAFDSSLNKLKNYIDYFENKGVRIVFFEVPVYKEFCHALFSNSIRNELDKIFPPERIRYIKQPNCEKYRTTDWIHLDFESGKKFTGYFLKELKEFDLKPFQNLNF